MKLRIDVPYNGIIYCFSPLNSSDYSRIEIPNVFIIDCFKEHNHLYCFKAFFYHKKRIVSLRSFKSKKELSCAVQSLLKEELNNV